MKTKKSVLVVGLFSFFWLDACATGNPSEGSDPDGGPSGVGTATDPTIDPAHPNEPAVTDIASYCKVRALRECTDAVARACGATSVSACTTTREARCNTAVPQGTDLLLEKVPACLAAVSAAHADTIVTSEERLDMKKACEDVLFSGPGAARTSCMNRYDCKTRDGLDCLIPKQATSGRCLKPNVVAPGAACPGEADLCADGYFCDDKSKQCLAVAQVNESCSNSLPCAANLRPCVDGGPFGAHCFAKTAEGLSCKEDADCADGLCDKLTNVADGTCAIKIEMTPLDAACASYR